MSNLNSSVLVVIKVFVLALFFIQNWRVSSVLTKSYLVYLYDRYGEELKLHREVVENSCKRWGHIKHRFLLTLQSYRNNILFLNSATITATIT